MSRIRPAAAFAALLAALAVLAVGAPAHAAPPGAGVAARSGASDTAAAPAASAAPGRSGGYRYWSFWEAGEDGTWTYATQGPATLRPADGDVHGFRFAVSADSQDAHRPRQVPDFAALCAGTPAKEGTKRVGLVLDFGVPADAPAGERPPAPRTACAQVPPDAGSADALAAVAPPLRYNSQALLCAIAGYPQRGCGEQVAAAPADSLAAPEPAATEAADGGGPSVGLAAGLAAVLLLGAAAVVRARRRGHR
ncbi:SCO2322 family protein [Streptomyces sp. CC210A]|uniref:SCO2322 family protein n=1 Tax=Streptomyces sp. CC210A TaxID=2898184 RepID=UPI001EEE8FCE